MLPHSALCLAPGERRPPQQQQNSALLITINLWPVSDGPSLLSQLSSPRSSAKTVPRARISCTESRRNIHGREDSLHRPRSGVLGARTWEQRSLGAGLVVQVLISLFQFNIQIPVNITSVYCPPSRTNSES